MVLDKKDWLGGLLDFCHEHRLDCSLLWKGFTQRLSCFTWLYDVDDLQ